MAKKCMTYREMRREFPNQVRNRCKICGSAARLYPSLWFVSYLLPRVSFERADTWRDEVILVARPEV